MARRLETVNIAEAKARLPELVERASTGEEIILARNGKPRARLVPIAPRKKYVYGAGKGKWRGTERLLDTPLPDDLLDAFDAGLTDPPVRHRE
jgi:prevent-host-death family protein